MNTIKIPRYTSLAGEMIVGSCGDGIRLCDRGAERHSKGSREVYHPTTTGR